MGRARRLRMHKTIEAERAIIISAGAEQISTTWQLADLPGSGQHDVELRERSSQYVAATRARDELVITGPGEVADYLLRVCSLLRSTRSNSFGRRWGSSCSRATVSEGSDQKKDEASTE